MSTYSYGQTKGVTDAFGDRTATSQAAYLLPYLEPSQKLLDVGCGPGSISCSFSQLVHTVTGIDKSAEVIEKAKTLAATHALSNITFQAGDATELPFPDDTFDVVHAHQVIVHLPKEARIAAFKEMRRVAKPGGLIATRDAIMDTLQTYPLHMRPTAVLMGRLIDEFGTADKNAGVKTHVWAQEAGLEVLLHTASAEVMNGDQGRKNVFTFMSDVAVKAVTAGLISADEWEKARPLWDEFLNDKNAWLVALNGEVVSRK